MINKLKKELSGIYKVLILVCVLPFLVSAYCIGSDNREGQTEDDRYTCVDVPRYTVFCGDTIDLTRYDRHERMDRELLAFSFMHSTSIQTIKRANRYFPVIVPILKEKGIPEDFKYLMAIESACNPLARSGAGAAGLWQFMPTTGKEYGLEVNSHVDERYNVEKATYAACKYLKDAYNKFGDWVSVAASYNAGQERISQQQEKQYTDETLDLYLVEETARYIYRIFAVKMLFENPTDFGFYLKSSDLYPQIHYRTVKVSETITDLARFAKSQGTTYALLKNLNPWLRSTSLPCKNGKEYEIKLPDKNNMNYNPDFTMPYSRNWVIDK
ncbi:lytic transglycosylase domain-containing protein [Bacteroides sp. ET336]|uniref:lytic transglycosylase domain-containing protein n=1 Tax=Bacteroides sp. ET336 TaxID=2972459 RepID=UPI0021ABE966|nr:lytic transglycosylase domain-containing protein [Bacteroides sp. ET336]MCR8893277.1 lytic transglycosylase domain-containing protein [Bacteroides sp. ET336]MDN0057774.1 lytic transglycosylase domain-containing protein [Bacteroides caecigallinarum]